MYGKSADYTTIYQREFGGPCSRETTRNGQSIEKENTAMIKRWCFDQTALISDLYDACEDQPLDEIPFTTPPSLLNIANDWKIVENGSTLTVNDYFIDRDQMMSLKAAMGQSNPFAEALSRMNEEKKPAIWLMYFTRTKRETLDLESRYLNEKWKNRVSRCATHLITGIEYGALVLLKLTSMDGSMDAQALEAYLDAIRGACCGWSMMSPLPGNIAVKFHPTTIDHSKEWIKKRDLENSVKIMKDIQKFPSFWDRKPIRYSLLPIKCLPAFSLYDQVFYSLSMENFAMAKNFLQEIDNLKQKVKGDLEKFKNFSGQRFLTRAEEKLWNDVKDKNLEMVLMKHIKNAIIDARSRNSSIESHPIIAICQKILYFEDPSRARVKFVGCGSSQKLGPFERTVFICGEWTKMTKFREEFQCFLEKDPTSCAFINFDSIQGPDGFPASPGIYLFRASQFLVLDDQQLIDVGLPEVNGNSENSVELYNPHNLQHEIAKLNRIERSKWPPLSKSYPVVPGPNPSNFLDFSSESQKSGSQVKSEKNLPLKPNLVEAKSSKFYLNSLSYFKVLLKVLPILSQVRKSKPSEVSKSSQNSIYPNSPPQTDPSAARREETIKKASNPQEGFNSMSSGQNLLTQVASTTVGEKASQQKTWNRLNPSDFSSQSQKSQPQKDESEILSSQKNPCPYPDPYLNSTLPMKKVMDDASNIAQTEQPIPEEFPTFKEINLEKHLNWPKIIPIENSQIVYKSKEKVKPEDCLDILLLGETGVGKSTFINSFANTLRFDDFEEAITNEITSIIPTLFTIEEQSLCMGEISEGDIENSEKGQSVTRETRSYLLQTNSKMIRIIDTPGMGDTAGPLVDAENFQNILDFVGKMEKIDAICILLKPNNARINLTFRYCINELLANLNQTAASNIIFCFTNSRQTFYRPGDSLPMLQKFLRDLKANDGITIEATKRTIFCFENEAFLCQAGRQGGIELEEDTMQHCRKSWTQTKRETDRLLAHIGTLPPHQIKDSITLNSARRVILALCKPLAEISTQIQSNVQELETKLDEVMTLKENEIEIEKYLGKRREVCVTKDFGEALYICQSKCTTFAEVDGLTNRIYSDECHRAKQKEKSKNSITKFVLKAWKKIKKPFKKQEPENCSACGCPTRYHEKIRQYEWQEWEYYQNPDLAAKLEENTYRKTQKEVICDDLKVEIERLKMEKQAILETAAQFTAFLRACAMVPMNDSVEANLLHAIQEEQLLLQMGGGSMKRLESYEKNLLEYREQKEMMKRMAETKDENILTPNEVLERIEELKRLAFSGAQINSLLEAAIRTQDHRVAGEELVYDFSHQN